MSTAFHPSTLNQGAMTVANFCQWASISRASFYREVAAGRLVMRKAGRKSVVAVTDAKAWLAALPTANNREAV